MKYHSLLSASTTYTVVLSMHDQVWHLEEGHSYKNTTATWTNNISDHYQLELLDLVRIVNPTSGQILRIHTTSHKWHSLFSSLSADSDPLAVGRPGNVFDLPRDRLILVLENVGFLSGVPDPDLARYV